MRTLGRAVKVQPKIKSLIIVGRRHTDEVKGGIFLGPSSAVPSSTRRRFVEQAKRQMKTTVSLQSAAETAN
jgi:hypothetical protein